MRNSSQFRLKMNAVLAVIAAALLMLFSGVAERAQAADYAGIVVDAKTGKWLYSHRATARHYPASLTKIMTLYMVFEALETGQVSKNTKIRFSRHAASMQPSKLGLKPGQSITVEQAILALVTKSANDVAAAVAEHLGGTESGFAQMMTRKARALGMDNTTFRNASGLPNSAQVTTARDMARLGIAIREHFPQYYDYFSRRSFTYAGRTMGNHNRLLGRIKGVDGIKTGYIRASGFNLVTSIERDGRSVVAVVLGGRTGKSRNAQMVKLLDRYFHRATKGADVFAIAKPGGSAVAVANLELPEDGPIPRFRRGGFDPASIRVATAHVISADVMPARAPGRDSRTAITAIQEKLRQIGSRRLPVPTPAENLADPDPVQTASLQTESTASSNPEHIMSYAAPQQTRAPSAIKRQGWQVQISAVDQQSAAIEMLEAAREKLPKLLSAYDNYTEIVEKEGVTLYRARFAGFDNKDEAWDACNRMKRNRINCLAIEN